MNDIKTAIIKLYAKDDAHCSPAYNGDYAYNLKDKSEHRDKIKVNCQ